MGLVGGGALLTAILMHLKAYSYLYAQAFAGFSGGFILKRLVKVAGNNEVADLLGLGGACVGIASIVPILSGIMKLRIFG